MNPLHCLIQQALTEDDVTQDVTASLLGSRQEESASAVLIAKKSGVFSGIGFLHAFERVWGNGLVLTAKVTEGEAFPVGMVLVQIKSTVGEILRLERTLINGLSHSCGVASATRTYVDKVAPLPVKILATRKTLPGLRDLELPAVTAGGGKIHRRSLSDGILIKENHQFWSSESLIIAAAKKERSPLHRIEIEVQQLSAVERVLALGPDLMLLDNFSIEDLRHAVVLIAGQCETEASGGVTLATVRAIAETGVNYISVGALTHSVLASDISLDFVRTL